MVRPCDCPATLLSRLLGGSLNAVPHSITMHARPSHPQAMISADQQEKLRELAESVAAGM